MNEQHIWNALLSRLSNPCGAAGLMGNLYAESALNPRNLQGSFEKKLGMTDEQYTAAVDGGRYANFADDGAGYGLAQWTYPARKEALLGWARNYHTSIGDLDTQLDFLIWELSTNYSGVLSALQNARTVREASDAVLLRYERPRDQSEAVRVRRAAYGQKYYDTYADRPTTEEGHQMFTGKQLAAYAEQVYAHKDHWAYWYGTYGKECTKSLYNSKKAQYPSHYGSDRTDSYMRDIAQKRRCADCVGLIKSFFWTGNKYDTDPKYNTNHCPDKSADGLFNMCKQTGPIKSIPDIPGLVVWKSGHIGVYVGGGYTVEMRGFDYDCQRRKVTSGPWKKWGKLPESMISYTTEAAPETPQTPPETPETPAQGLSRGDHGSAVTAMQRALLAWKPGCLPKWGADGDFGSETEAALKDFQKGMGLPVTGVYDAVTREALTTAQAAPPAEDPAPLPDVEGPEWVLATGNVNVRAAPGTDSRVLGVLHKMESAPYQGEKREWGGRDWYLIEFEGENGWVSSKYAELTVG